jgi:hypothetical protein
MKLSTSYNRSDETNFQPDAEIRAMLKDGIVTITSEANGINETNFHFIPSFISNIYREDIREYATQTLINKIGSVEAKNLLTEQLISKPKEDEPKRILWDSSESYKPEGLTAEEREEISRELDLDEDDIVDEIDANYNSHTEDLEVRMGYANFDVTPYAGVISKCEGVDTFVQLSRYRFALTIGKHWFNFTDIRKKLTKMLKLEEIGV